MTPDNAVYYHVAYVVALVVYAGYTALLWRRRSQTREALRRAHGEG